MIKKIYLKFSKPKNLAILNGVLISIIIACNLFFQGFCIPTNWALITLVICFSNTITYPLIDKTRFRPITSFLNGISVMVFLYCVCFLEQMNLAGIYLAIFGIGFILLIPHFFIIQLIWRTIFKSPFKSSKYYFLTGIAACIITIFYAGKEYQKAINSFEKFKENNYAKLDKNFMTEKILGMHFIYHTRIEIVYDGWRPPKHEPLLVIGMWLNNRIDPLELNLENRLKLYKKFFPENQYKFSCSCGYMYNNDYHNDQLWK